MRDEAFLKRNFWWVGLIGWVTASAVSAESWLPTQYTVQAYALAERCQTYRAAEKQITDQIADQKNLLQEEQTEAKARRITLEDCGKNRGLMRFKAPIEEATLAEVCVEEYESWLSPGARVRVLESELTEATQALGELKGTLQWRCGKLPTGFES